MNVNLLELDLSSNANIKAKDFKRKVSYHKTKVAEKKKPMKVLQVMFLYEREHYEFKIQIFFF